MKKRKPYKAQEMKISKVMAVLVTAFLFGGCASLRSNLVAGLNFTEQAPKNLIDIECHGKRHVSEGVAVCEEKSPKTAKISVKIMPAPGRVVFSDGLRKQVSDFNWRKTGWIWKSQVIDTSWIDLDLGELDDVYGEKPVEFVVQAQTDSGVINTNGVIYYRTCNDRDVPCSRLIVNYDCSGKIGNTYEGQIGACARMAGTSQDFSIPLKTLNYQFSKGSEIRVRAGRSGWTFSHTVDDKDIQLGEVKFRYPEILVGPEIFSLSVFQWEQGVLQTYPTFVLISGYSAKWTGIDRPHFYNRSDAVEWCTPFTADLLEVVTPNQTHILNKECVDTSRSAAQTCAYAFDRESGDSTYTCIKNDKEVRFP